ncbi:MAG: hypothetical protein FWH15_07945 [Betaproteobacteria bacterium]|nr:hypothetical protein [Betaproteobacteria bacterium]
MSFRDLVSGMDDAVFGALSDAAVVDGRAVSGMFNDPYLSPMLGALKTDLREPTLALRSRDASGIRNGSVVEIVESGGRYTVTSVERDGTGITTLVLRPQTMPPGRLPLVYIPFVLSATLADAWFSYMRALFP